MNFRKKVQDQSLGFQMAPMVDVMFLLLIFFMTASIYAQLEKKLDITIPSAETGQESKRFPGEIIINVDAEGKIFLNSIERSGAQLEETLKSISALYQGQPVTLRVDEDAPHRHFVNIFDLCRKYKISNVNIASLPIDKDKK